MHSPVNRHIHQWTDTFTSELIHSPVNKYIHQWTDTFTSEQIHSPVSRYIHLWTDTFTSEQIHSPVTIYIHQWTYTFTSEHIHSHDSYPERSTHDKLTNSCWWTYLCHRQDPSFQLDIDRTLCGHRPHIHHRYTSCPDSRRCWCHTSALWNLHHNFFIIMISRRKQSDKSFFF